MAEPLPIDAAVDPWLVVIDPQRIFADPASDWGSPMFAESLGSVRELADAVGRERTLLTRWLPGEHVGSWGDYFRRWPFADRPATDPVHELVEGARELSSRPPVEASTFGKWDRLREVTGETPTLVLAGVATDCCVISTALPAADAGAHVVVAADACAGSDQGSHDAALHVMGLYAPQIVVTDSARVLASLRP